jgi:hypothetical protein
MTILERQRRQIKGFIRKKGRKQTDALGIYLWIERCHYQGWWDLGVELASYLPPNSLSPDYQKRLEYLANDCRNRLSEEFVSLRNPRGTRFFYVPRKFWDACKEHELRLGGKSNKWLRLEYKGEEVIVVERIKLDGCLLKFTRWSKEKLTEWLKNHDRAQLSSNMIPRGEKVRRHCWLRLNWAEAAELIPCLKELAETRVREYEKAFLEDLKTMPIESRQRFVFALDLYSMLNNKGLFLEDSSLKHNGVKIRIDRARRIDLNCAVSEHLIRIGISINKGGKAKEQNEALFDKLISNRNQIEKEFGQALYWERLEEKAGCRIGTILNIGGYKDDDEESRIKGTAILAMQKLISVFKTALSSIN